MSHTTETELSPNQREFLAQCGYINLFEWRLFGHNSSRILHPTAALTTSKSSWFYVGLPPYNLHPINGGAMEKPWPKTDNPQIGSSK